MKESSNARLPLVSGILCAILIVAFTTILKRIEGVGLYAVYIALGLACYVIADLSKRIPIKFIYPVGVIAWVGIAAYFSWLLY